jgi:hypothetical protein
MGSLGILEDGKMLIHNGSKLAAYPSASGAVTLPNSITSIGDSAFWDCAALTSVSLPEVTSIGSSAFEGCAALTSVNFPEATAIGKSAFSGCDTLTSVSFPQATSIGIYAFYGCDTLTSISFPQATSIGNSAFRDCAALTSISFPQATSIGNSAFSYCAALTSVTLGATPPTLESYIFYGISSPQTVTVKIPESAKTAYGVPNLPDINFDNSSTSYSWGRAFKGLGQSGGMAGTVNTNITLVFETYTE